MTLSTYVINELASIKQSPKYKRYDAVHKLKAAAESAPCKQDSYSLNILSGVLSMCYNTKEHQFSPMMVLYIEKKRSFAIEDIPQEDIALLEDAANNTENIYMRTRFLHVAWVLSNNPQYGQEAVKGYLEIFEDSFNPTEWVECNDAIQSAFHIATILGKKSDSLKRVRTAINNKLKEMNGHDPLFLSIALLELVIKSASETELESYLLFAENLSNKNLTTANLNTNLADKTFEIQEQILKRLKKEDDIKIATEVYANYYESLAETFTQEGENLRAVIMLKKACHLYSKVNRDKLLELRNKLEKLQKLSLKEMHHFKYEINAKPIYKSIEKLFNGLSLPDSIIQLGRLATIHNIEELKKDVIRKQSNSFFTSMFSNSMLNEKGQTVQELAPLSATIESTDPEVLHKHMVKRASEHRSLSNPIVLNYAFSFFKKSEEFSKDSLNFLVDDNAIIPDNRAEIIKDGLYLGLSGNLYAAMHILLPQTENIFRNLVKNCGDTITFLKEDGTETYKPLSALLKSEKLKECYDENIIFTFQSIMDDPIGENLRNLNAHGVLEPEKGNGSSALYFLCLVIRLLSMYSPNAFTIVKKLAEKDSCTETE